MTTDCNNKFFQIHKIISFFALICVSLFLTHLDIKPAKAQEEAITFLRIGTGPPEGTYFPIGGMLANIVSQSSVDFPCKPNESCLSSRLIAVAQSSDGSLENIQSIKQGTFESVLCQGDIAYWAYVGKGVFQKQTPFEDLRAIANLYPETVHIVVPEHSKIKSIKDLKGKTIAVGEEKSGSVISARNLLKAYGVPAKKVKFSYIAPGVASDYLREGKIDAFVQTAGSPVNSITELAENFPVRLIPIDEKIVEKLRKKFPFFGYTKIAADTYKNVPETGALTIGAQWLISKKVPEIVVYNITKALWEEKNLNLLKSSHPKGEYIQLDTALDGLGVPLHHGAEKFYNEHTTLNTKRVLDFTTK